MGYLPSQRVQDFFSINSTNPEKRTAGFTWKSQLPRKENHLNHLDFLVPAVSFPECTKRK